LAEASVKKVVVVEDDPELRELETFLLEAEGYQAIGVPDGDTAAAVTKAEAADLVLLDLMLPRKDGNAVLVDLAADPATANVPVVVISAYLHQLRATPQVKRVLAKPFDINDLLEAVESVLEAA
jgi:DNA-binding response OmpR family regulator